MINIIFYGDNDHIILKKIKVSHKYNLFLLLLSFRLK